LDDGDHLGGWSRPARLEMLHMCGYRPGSYIFCWHVCAVVSFRSSLHSLVTPSDGVSSTELQNNSIFTSIGTIQEKVDLLIQTLEKMQSAQLPLDHSILRAAAKICDQLKGSNNTVSADSLNEVMDCLMISYLGISTKTSNDLCNFSELNHTIYSDDRR
jgi:hypothetical protein